MRRPKGSQVDAYGLKWRGNHLIGVGKATALDPRTGIKFGKSLTYA